jgi:prevent-host-death family protein
MRVWSLEKAKNSFSEIVRLALAHEPQLVTRGRSGAEAVVVLSREDYEAHLAPVDLYEAMQASPLARAIAEGAFGDANTDPFPRPRDYGRDTSFE